MAKLCRITLLAFVFGDIPKGEVNGYTDWDLENTIDYCDGLLEEGFTHDPVDRDVNLRAFKTWAIQSRQSRPEASAKGETTEE